MPMTHIRVSVGANGTPAAVKYVVDYDVQPPTFHELQGRTRIRVPVHNNIGESRIASINNTLKSVRMAGVFTIRNPLSLQLGFRDDPIQVVVGNPPMIDIRHKFYVRQAGVSRLYATVSKIQRG